MITREEFIEIIDKLREVNDFVRETNKRARKLHDAIISDFYNTMSLSISHEQIVLELLENMFNDTDGTISWWLYELDYGREYEDYCITVDDKPIDLSDAGELYDYLIKEMEESKCN